MSRFHIRPEAISGDRVAFDAEETRHLARVLRLRPGDLVRAVDGQGHEFTVRLTRVTPRAAEGEVVARTLRPAESPLHLTLAQGIPKGDKMESIVRMATELGVARIVPLVTERTVARAPAPRWAGRLGRWQRVAREAAKQSGRAVIPEVAAPAAPAQWLADRTHARGLFLCFWEEAGQGLAGALPPGPVERATAVVGPEGGLTADEVAAFSQAGAAVVGLGARILRTETAGPVALALLQLRYGDLGVPR